jgi:hypothetical protein
MSRKIELTKDDRAIDLGSSLRHAMLEAGSYGLIPGGSIFVNRDKLAFDYGWFAGVCRRAMAAEAEVRRLKKQLKEAQG